MAQKPSAAVLQVFVFKNGEFLGTDLFTERQVVVGRDATADLVLESTTVSRSHAVLEHDGRRVFVKDAGSTNGVFVNDAKIERAEIGRLDQIFIGEYSLKLKLVVKGGGAALEGEDETMPGGGFAQEVTGIIGDAAAMPKKPAAAPAPVARAKTPEAKPHAAVEAPRAEARPKAAAPGRVDPAAAARKADEPRKADAQRQAEVQRQADDQRKADEQRRAQAEAKRSYDEAQARRAREEAEAKRADAGAKKAPPAEAKRGREADGRQAPAVDRPAFFEGSAPHPAVQPAADKAKAADNSRPAVEPAPARRPAPVHDDEDDEAPWVPTFSMLRQTLDASRADDKPTHVEVLVARAGSLSEAVTLASGDAYFAMDHRGKRPRRRRVATFKGGECRLELSSEAKGSVLRKGERVDLTTLAKRTKTGLEATLGRGDFAEIDDGARKYHVRFVRPPILPRDLRPLRDRLRPDRTITRAAGGSFGGHLMLVLVGFLMPARAVAPPQEAEAFAEVVLDKELKLEEPPAPPPEPVKEAPAAPAPPKVAKQMEAAPNPRPRAGGTAKAPPGVLGLLSKTGSSAAPGPAAALAAVSNLSAANAPGAAGGFRVSGLTSNLPTSDILVGGGGGGGLVTKGGAALLRGGGGGAGALSGKGERGVGGMVQKMPQAMRAAGQGSLDRDAIQKVINANVSQIQRCYERELINKPGLSGKVEVEWTVGTSGAVKGVRQKFSSLDSLPAVNCILEHIRGWQFPQPKGGEVVVSYPFVFKSISF